MQDNIQSYRRSLFQKSETFPDDFMKQCKDNENEARFIPLEVNNKKTNGDGTRIICTSGKVKSKGFEMHCRK